MALLLPGDHRGHSLPEVQGLKVSFLCDKMIDLQRKPQLMSSFIEPSVPAIISHYDLLSFSSDELWIHLSIVSLAEASTGGEIQGETSVLDSHIRQGSPLQDSFCKAVQRKF